ncbi:insulinase family protein [Candidatus Fermentibacteria bacterium]|nr:insulinase family protein [Candidatus Fermentibacteria bacterium]
MKRYVIAMSCVALSALFGASAADPGPQSDVHVRTLANGLTVAVREHRAVPGVSIRIYVKVGSALEEEYLGYGVSHYCEHLVSGGTTTLRSEEEIDRTVQLMGAQRNAYTTTDHTCYHAYCAVDHWEGMLEALAECVMHCAMAPEELAREKGVITREINMGEDEPGRVIHKLLMNTVYPNSPLGIPTIGYRDLFSRLTPEEVTAFYRRHYTPGNTVVVMVGNLSLDAAVAKVEELMGEWPRGPLFRIPLAEEPPQTSVRRVSREWPGDIAYLRVAWPGITLTHADLYPLDMVAAVLGHGKSSRLYRTLKEDRRLVHDIGAYSLTPAIAPGPFVVWALVPADKVNEAAEAIVEQVESVKVEGVSPQELERAKNQVIASYSFGQQACEDMAATIGGDLIRTGDPSFSSRYTQGMAAVGAEEIQSAARRYLLPDRASFVSLGGEALRSPAQPASGLDAKTEIAAFTLANGLRVVTRENPHVDVVSIQAMFRGGNRHETEVNNGVFTLLSQLLTKGTKRRTAAQIVDLVESRGGSIESGSGKDGFWIRLDLRADDLGFGMSLLGELLTQSTFSQEELDKQKTQALARLQEQENDWQSEAITHYLATYFGDHPYRLNGIGTGEAISSMSRDDVVEAFQDYVRAGSGVVAICGGVTAAEAAEEAGRYLAAVPGGSCPVAAPASVPERTGLEHSVKLNDKAQVAICLGYPAPPLGHSDEHALRLMDAVTSGIRLPRGWLHHALRGRSNLVYYVHLIPILYRDAGTVVVLTQCQPDLVDTVLALVQHELTRARAGEFSEEDIAAAKGEYVTAMDNDMQTTADQAYRLASYELLGIGHDAAFRFEDGARAVTVEDVRRVAAQYLEGGVLSLTGPLGDG